MRDLLALLLLSFTMAVVGLPVVASLVQTWFQFVLGYLP